MNLEPESKPSLWERVIDNPWLLLVLGVALPMISYTLWGWIELLRTPPAPLP